MQTAQAAKNSPGARPLLCGGAPHLRFDFAPGFGLCRRPSRLPPIPGSPSISKSFVALYKDLHTHPELSFQELETAKRMAAELGEAGAEVTSGVGKLGVVGVLKNGPGPVVLVRTDMDALPVVEETGLPYASKTTATDKAGRSVGVMHACGHDVHMTCFIGTARWLAEHKDRWSGTVLLVAQPAEEAVGGARAMLDDGLYSRFPKPDFALALHCTRRRAGRDGLLLPGPDARQLDVGQRSPFAARAAMAPGRTGRSTRSSWRRSSSSICRRSSAARSSRSEPAVVTVGSIHGGTKHNIIPDEVKLQLTLRTFSEPVRQQLIAGIKRRVAGLAQAHQAPEPTVEIEESIIRRSIPRLWSNGSCRPSSRRSARPNVQKAKPVMGAEDFSLYRRSECTDLHVLARHDRCGTPRSRAIEARRFARPPLIEILSRSRPKHRDRYPRHDRRGRQALAAEVRISAGHIRSLLARPRPGLRILSGRPGLLEFGQ